MRDADEYFGPIPLRALRLLSDIHESSSQNDLSVIGPIHPSGQPFAAGLKDGMSPNAEDDEYGDDDEEVPGPPPFEVCAETDIRVVAHCSPGDEDGIVYGPRSRKGHWKYFVSYGSSIMVQTYALDIMEAATQGNLTPLRLWRLAMKQGFYDMSHPFGLKGMDYGEISEMQAKWEDYRDEVFPDLFPGLGKKEWDEVNGLQEAEFVKQQFVHKGKFWIWMAPDRFPVSPTEHDPPAPMLVEVSMCQSHTPLEGLPLNILTLISSNLPLKALLNLASTSRFLRNNIIGNQQLAQAWISTNAPWWIPIPTRTPVIANGEEFPPTISLPYLASEPRPAPHEHEVEGQRPGVANLDWAYIRRCAHSGSMRNRQRIWRIIPDIERVADELGV